MNKYILILIVSAFSTLVFAQTVEQVNGAQVVLSIQGAETITAGDHLNFLSKDLEVVGRGEVTKVSAGGKKALAKVTSGNVVKGMTVEKATDADTAQKSSPKKQIDSSADQGLDRDRNLSEEDRKVLRTGYIDTPRYVIGGLLGIYPGLGIGHAVQGRYSDRGWIFTVGELASSVGALAGAVHCFDSVSNSGRSCDGTLFTVSAATFIGFKIWEIVDVWVGPINNNDRYRELRRIPSDDNSAPAKPNVTWNGMIIPTKDGLTAGLGMTF